MFELKLLNINANGYFEIAAHFIVRVFSSINILNVRRNNKTINNYSF